MNWKLCTLKEANIRSGIFLSPVATKLRKGDIGLPFVSQSVRPYALNNFKTFGPILMITHTGLLLDGFLINNVLFAPKGPIDSM